MQVEIEDLEVLHSLLNRLFDIKEKLDKLDNILGTDRNDESMRNIGGFLISPTLYYSIYEQIKSEYLNSYKEAKALTGISQQ